MLLVLVMVFVKFPKEVSGGISDSLGEIFILEEDVDFFCIEVGCTPCVVNFYKRE